MQHLQGLEFGKVGQVEAIELIKIGKQLVTLGAGEAEKVHGMIVHAHQRGDVNCQGRGDIIGVRERTERSVAGIKQVEVIAWMIASQIGINAQKTGKANEKDQMEIAEAPTATIEESQRMVQVLKERKVFFLLPHRPIEELGKEHRNGLLVWVVGNADIGQQHLGLLQLEDFGRRLEVGFELKHRQGLEEHGLDTGLARLWYAQHELAPSILVGIDVGNERRVLILDDAKHDGTYSLLHI